MNETQNNGSTIIKAIEAAYDAVRSTYPDLPQVVATTGTGLQGRGLKWGHFGAGRWQVLENGRVVDESGRLPEVFIAGERLHCGAQDTLATIIHEAVHALATVRGVKEVSRDARYHNRKFVALAEELGMEWPEGQAPNASIGFSAVVLTDETVEEYSETIEALATAINVHLDTLPRLGIQLGGKGEGGEGTEGVAIPVEPAKPKSRSNIKATCECGHIVRMSAKVLEMAVVECSECEAPFTEA